MKNQKSESKKISLESLNKLKKDLGSQEISNVSNGGLYRFPEHIKGNKKKETSFRTNLRIKVLDGHLNRIVRSGKINNNLINDLESFKEDYFRTWLINDFKIESFTICRSDELKAEYVLLLDKLKQYIELSK